MFASNEPSNINIHLLFITRPLTGKLIRTNGRHNINIKLMPLSTILLLLTLTFYNNNDLSSYRSAIRHWVRTLKVNERFVAQFHRKLTRKWVNDKCETEFSMYRIGRSVYKMHFISLHLRGFRRLKIPPTLSIHTSVC